MLACIYLVDTADVTRSQTGDTDWEHKPKSKISYFCDKKENYAQAATVSSWHYTIDYDIIDNICKAQTIFFYKFALYQSPKSDKTQFLCITQAIYGSRRAIEMRRRNILEVGLVNSNTTKHKHEHSSIVIERRKCPTRHSKAASALKLFARITVNTAGRALERTVCNLLFGNL